MQMTITATKAEARELYNSLHISDDIDDVGLNGCNCQVCGSENTFDTRIPRDSEWLACFDCKMVIAKWNESMSLTETTGMEHHIPIQFADINTDTNVD